MFDLQLFAGTAVSGKKIIYLYRILKDAATKAGTTLAFTTENSTTKSKDADTTATKDGSIRTPSATEVEIKCTCLLAQGDTYINDLEDAMDEDELIEIWEVNLANPASGSSGKYEGVYYQGYITEIERTANAEDNVEVSLTIGVNGAGQRGSVTVTADQEAAALYAFKDSVKTGA